LGLRREDFQRRIGDKVSKLGYKGIMTKGISDFTRHQFVENKLVKNYLDSFVSYGVTTDELNIRKPIGSSDHWTLELRIKKEELEGKIILNKQLIESFSKAKGEVKNIKDRLKEALKGDRKKEKLLDLIDELNDKYKMRVRRPKNIYVMGERIRKQLLDGKKDKAFREMKRICRNASKEEYSIFLEQLEELRINRRTKEYFHRLRFYTDIDKNTDILKNLIDGVEGKVITNKLDFNERVLKKYSKIFADNGQKDRYYFDRETGVVKVNAGDVLKALDEMNNDKAMSFDYIHGTVYDLLMKDKDRHEIAENIAEVINEILKEDTLPEKLFTARLFCLNKEGSKPGSVETIRPIAIESTLIKIVEKVLLNRIEGHIYSRKLIHVNQTGFVKGAGADMNVVKLRDRGAKIKKENGKEKYVYFVDLKNAYDSVNHRLLFSKMEKCGIDNKTTNTVRLLYSNARLMLDRVSGPININKGVLQGSLISPLLFNVYINDMVMELSTIAFDVLAYADDIAVLCRDRRELNTVIDVVENWSKCNLIAVNKKKSGIMRI
jgi:hypothetical protein